MEMDREPVMDLSHITMGVDLEARRRHAHSSITQGTSCVPKQRVRV